MEMSSDNKPFAYFRLRKDISGTIDNIGLHAIIVGLIFASLSVIVTYRFATVPATHTELTAGYLTWAGQSKTLDYLLPLLIAFVFLAVVLCTSWTHLLVGRMSSDAAERLSSLVLICDLPGIAGIAAWTTNAGGKDLIVLSAILIGVLGLAVWTTIIKRSTSVGYDIGELWVASLVVFVLGAFVPIVLGVGLSRLLAWNIQFVGNTSIVLCGVAFLIVFLISQAVGNTVPRPRFASWLIMAIQFSGPLGFLLLVPPALALSDGTLLAQSTSWRLRMVIASGIALAWWSIFFRKFHTPKNESWLVIVSPWTLAAFLVVLRFGPWPLPSISSDDYHFGEILVPAWMASKFGAWPYIDVTPAHGLADYIGHTLNLLFYDGTAANLGMIHYKLGNVLLLLVLFCLLRPLLGQWVSFAICAIFPTQPLPPLPAIYFVAIVLLARCNSVATLWVPIWIVVGTLAVLFTPGAGSVMAAASIPLGSYLIFYILRKDARTVLPGVLLLLLAAVVLSFTPFPKMVLGALRYVLDNIPINTTAHGLPWELSRIAVPYGPNGGSVYEILRSSWIAIPIVLAVAVIIVYAKDYSSEVRFEVVAAASVGGLFLLMMIPYTMGRIDPGSSSRMGFFSAWSWAVIVPLAVFPLGATLFRIRVLAVAAIVCCALYPVTIGSIAAATRHSLALPELTDGASIGLPQLGRAVTDPVHLDRLTGLKKILDELLPAGAPYLDLTSSSARYFYLARPQPIEIGAPYNIVSLAQQRRAVDRLSAKPPAIALLDSQDVRNDGRSVAIRSHELYRFVVQNYTPVTVHGFIFGVHRSRPDLLSAVNESLIPSPFTDINWDRGISRGSAGFLVSQPYVIRGLKAGAMVRFTSSGARRIEKLEGSNVWIDGPPLDPVRDGFPNQIGFSVSEHGRSEWRLVLFDQAFRIVQHDLLPKSWGHSFRSLLDKIEPAGTPVGTPVSLNNMRREADGSFVILGPDPHIILDISNTQLSGSHAGLLKLHFECLGRQGTPEIEVYFAAAGETLSEDTVVRAAAENGDLLIPLDAQPRWLLAKELGLLRLDLTDHRTCTHVRFDAVQLWRRKAF